jgi:Lrp/AsnC family transcriptional regulator for asnA, asnC and gidA
MSETDMLDRNIIDLLMQDGRMSCAEIARRISRLAPQPVSERSVRYRIERLVRQETIRIGAIVNPKSFNYDVVADVVIEVEPGRVQEVARQLVTCACVSYVACSTGDRDISIQVFARDNAELYTFVSEVVGKVPGVRRTTTFLVPLILKDVYQWHIPRGYQGEGEGGAG